MAVPASYKTKQLKIKEKSNLLLRTKEPLKIIMQLRDHSLITCYKVISTNMTQNKDRIPLLETSRFKFGLRKK